MLVYILSDLPYIGERRIEGRLLGSDYIGDMGDVFVSDSRQKAMLCFAM